MTGKQGFWIAISATLLAVLCGLWACERTEGKPVDFDSLGYTACEQNEDCLPLGFCGEAGYCINECRKAEDCWLYISESKDLEDLDPEALTHTCVDYRCVLLCLTDADCIVEGDICHLTEPAEDEEQQKGYCYPPECSGKEDCADGQTCSGGICVAETAPDGDTDTAADGDTDGDVDGDADGDGDDETDGDTEADGDGDDEQAET